MTLEEVQGLKPGDRVYFGDDQGDTGTVWPQEAPGLHVAWDRDKAVVLMPEVDYPSIHRLTWAPQLPWMKGP